MSEKTVIWADCPICGKRIEIEVDVKTITTAPSYPVTLVKLHGTPRHLIVLFVDAQFQVRGVEGHKMLLTEEVKDAVALGREERKALGRLAEIPDLVEGLRMIRGVEFVDSKGVAIVSLPEAGPTIGNLLSPSGRIKARFIVADQEVKQKIEMKLREVINALEDFAPLSPVTLRFLMKLIEESTVYGEALDSSIIQKVAESGILIPIIAIKPMMFEAVRNYVLTSDFAAQELDVVRPKLDGYSTLQELMRLVDQKGLSVLRLLQALEKLYASEAINFRKRDEALVDL